MGKYQPCLKIDKVAYSQEKRFTGEHDPLFVVILVFFLLLNYSVYSKDI